MTPQGCPEIGQRKATRAATQNNECLRCEFSQKYSSPYWSGNANVDSIEYYQA